jgi:hypothetical protein
VKLSEICGISGLFGGMKWNIPLAPGAEGSGKPETGPGQSGTVFSKEADLAKMFMAQTHG